MTLFLFVPLTLIVGISVFTYSPTRIWLPIVTAANYQKFFHPYYLGVTWTTIEKYANLCGFLTYFNTIPNNNGIACPDPLPFYGGGTTHPDQHGAAIVRTPSGIRLYSGNDGGWWAQDSHSISVGGIGFDNDTWRSLNSPSTVLPWDVTFLQDGSIVLALQDNGVAHIKNGKSYQVCGGDGVYVFPGANARS